MSDITQKQLKEKYTYNPDTGLFYTNKDWGKFKKGTAVGYIHKNGYIIVDVIVKGRTKKYKAHRLAWLYMYGKFPNKDLVIDHINQIRTDNRIINLRVVNKSMNRRNCSTNSLNTSGVTGVTYQKDRNRWYAYIKINGKMKSLGRHKTFEEAVIARKEAERVLGFSANHGSPRKVVDAISWTEQIKENANYTCSICGSKDSIVAHHLQSIDIERPETYKLRYDIDNGVCLCSDCHIKFHKEYGYGNNTTEQFNEYIRSK